MHTDKAFHEEEAARQAAEVKQDSIDAARDDAVKSAAAYLQFQCADSISSARFAMGDMDYEQKWFEVIHKVAFECEQTKVMTDSTLMRIGAFVAQAVIRQIEAQAEFMTP